MPPWIARMQNTPIIGEMIRNVRYENIQYHYNVSTNFIEGNRNALKSIKNVVEDEKYLEVIIKEAEKNIEQAK